MAARTDGTVRLAEGDVEGALGGTAAGVGGSGGSSMPRTKRRACGPERRKHTLRSATSTVPHVETAAAREVFERLGSGPGYRRAR